MIATVTIITTAAWLVIIGLAVWVGRRIIANDNKKVKE